MAKPIEEAVEEIVVDLIKDSGMEVVTVEYVRERDWYLRVFLDKEGGIDLDDCQSVSSRLEEVLDAQDLIKGSYILEVSSPGLDRELKKPRDFQREQGKAIDVSLYAPLETDEKGKGSKLITGVLNGYDGDSVTVDEKVIPMEKVSQIRLHIDF